MIKKLKRKLKSRAGLTLTELLVTLLILSMFSIACLIGITTAFRARTDNIKANDADILASMVTQLITEELRMCDNVSQSSADSITYRSYTKSIDNVTLCLKEFTTSDGTAKKGLYMTIAGATDQPMLNTAAYTVLHLDNLTFTPDDSAGTVEVHFEVRDDDNNMELATADFTVQRLNVDTSSDP